MKRFEIKNKIMNTNNEGFTYIFEILGKSKTAKGIMRQWEKKIEGTARVVTAGIYFDGIMVDIEYIGDGYMIISKLNPFAQPLFEKI